MSFRGCKRHPNLPGRRCGFASFTQALVGYIECATKTTKFRIRNPAVKLLSGGGANGPGRAVLRILKVRCYDSRVPSALPAGQTAEPRRVCAARRGDHLVRDGRWDDGGGQSGSHRCRDTCRW
eukprot:scaffold191704_cov35-Prasinocladus_malaysianus.AAC.2